MGKEGNPYKTIGKAVNVSFTGDTISVAAGTYDEQVVINKSLTLQGAGDTTIIQPTTITQTFNRKKVGETESDPTNAIVVATVNVGTPNSVTIKDLKIDSSQVTVEVMETKMLASSIRGRLALLTTSHLPVVQA